MNEYIILQLKMTLVSCVHQQQVKWVFWGGV